MEETLYDKSIANLLNIPIVVCVVLFCVILIAIPQIQDGIKSIFNLFKKKKKDFILKYTDETITFDEILISRDFDIIRINATTHLLGVLSERKWLKHKYPKYVNNVQQLRIVKTKQGEKIFDVLPITIGTRKKSVYFDISSFYNGASVPFSNSVNDYVTKKYRRCIIKLE